LQEKAFNADEAGCTQMNADGMRLNEQPGLCPAAAGGLSLRRAGCRHVQMFRLLINPICVDRRASCLHLRQALLADFGTSPWSGSHGLSAHLLPLRFSYGRFDTARSADA
jgi:hypothetical protein